MKSERGVFQKRSVGGSHHAYQKTSVLMLGVYFFLGILLVLGQLVPGGTQQVANGESLPQVLLWLLVGALFATDHVLNRYVSVQGRLLAMREDTSRPRRQLGFVLLLAGLLFWIVFATRNVLGQGNLRFAVNGCWQWFAWVMAIIVLSRIMVQPRIHRGVQWLMIALAWLVAIHGFYQVFVSLPADRERFRANPEAVLREAGIDAPVGSATYMLFEQRLQDDAPTGPFALTNSLAGFLVPWILVLIAQFFRKDFWAHQRSLARFVGFAVLACLCACLIFTKSRTGWIAVGAGTFAMILSQPQVFRSMRQSWQGLWLGDLAEGHLESDTKSSGRLVRRNAIGFAMSLTIALIMSIAIILVGLYWWDPKLLSEASRSLAFRSEYWRTTLRIVADHPWLGIGPGNFQAYYAMYKPVLESETIADPHNFLLETLVTAGFPALILLMTFPFSFMRPIHATEKSGLVGERSMGFQASVEENHVGPRALRSAAYALFVGAFVGALAVWLGSGAVGPIPDYVPYLFAIPLVIAAAIFQFLIVERSQGTSDVKTLSAVGFGPALLGIGVHLMASGGWMTSGICNSIAVLVAGLLIACRHSNSEEQRSSSHRSDMVSTESMARRIPPVFSFGTLVMAWLLVVVFYLTAWLPRQRTQQIEAEVEKRGGIDESLAIAMLNADRWNPTGFRWLADVRLTQVKRELTLNPNGVAPSFDRFRESAQAYLAADRINWETWAQLGHWELSISSASRESLTRALKYYREATQRAPGDVGLLTQAALAAWMAADRSVMKEFLSRAEAIDTQITHRDRKLDKAIIFWPADVGPPSTSIMPSVWQAARDSVNLPLGWVRAEPVYRFLRSQ